MIVGNMMRCLRLPILPLLAIFIAAGCGSSTNGTGSNKSFDCGFDGSSFAPLKEGYTWQYQVFDSDTGEPKKPKQLRIDRSETHPDYGEVFIQVSEKTNSRTEHLTRIEGDQVIRFEERKFDPGESQPRTTTKYVPHRIRVDESVENLTKGAEYEDRYDAIELDASMVEVKTEKRVDRWEVISSEAECRTALGTADCLYLIRTRYEIEAEVEVEKNKKGFFFAAGVGKVIETGSDEREELTDCEAL